MYKSRRDKFLLINFLQNLELVLELPAFYEAEAVTSYEFCNEV